MFSNAAHRIRNHNIFNINIFNMNSLSLTKYNRHELTTSRKYHYQEDEVLRVAKQTDAGGIGIQEGGRSSPSPDGNESGERTPRYLPQLASSVAAGDGSSVKDWLKKNSSVIPAAPAVDINSLC